MFKKLLQLKTFLIALLVMTGAGNVWAETVTFDPSDFSGQGTSGTGSAISATNDGVTFACNKGYGTTTHFRCYGGATITISSSKTITAISFTFSSGSYTGGLETSYTGLSATTWVKNLNSQARITEVTVTYTTSGSPSINADNLSIAYGATSGNIDYTISNGVQGGGLTADITDGGWLTLGDVTSETVPFTCSANDGDADRTATVTLTYTYNTNQTVTKVVTITQGHPVVDYATLPFEWEGGASTALTKLDGVTASGLGSDYAEGNAPYRVKLDTDDDYIQVKTDSQPGTVTIGVKMIGGANTSTITVQGSADGVTFTNVEALSISGSQNAELTLETSNPFATNSRYVRLLFTKGSNVGVGPITIAKPSTDPAIDAVSSVELAAEDTSGEIAYKIANPVDGTSLTASEEADWISNVTVQSDKVTFATTANSGELRSAIITLTYGSITKEVTVRQAEYVVIKTYSIATSITSGKHYIITNGSAKAMGTQTTNNRAAGDVTTEENVVTVANSAVTEFVIYGPDADGYYSIYDEKNRGFLYAASSSSNYLRTQSTNDDNGLWTISFEGDGHAVITAQGANTHNLMRYNSSNSLFSCYASVTQGIWTIYLYEKDGETTPTQSVSVSAAGYATFSSTNALDFTDVEGICAYTATVENEAISFKRVNKVPANTGVLLRSVEGGAVEDAVPSLTGAADKVTGNLFVAVSEDITSLASEDANNNNNNYILNNGSNGVGFYLANGKKVGAGKAYLAVPKTASVRGFISFDFSDPETGIATVGGNVIESTAFDLQGRRVSTPKNGLYIINGKKVLVK